MPDPAPSRFHCPRLSREVEFPRERELHLEARHPDLLPRHRTRLAEVLADPDLVRRSDGTASLLLFSRWYTDRVAGEHVVVAVMQTARARARPAIVAAYRVRRLRGGEVLWRRG